MTTIRTNHGRKLEVADKAYTEQGDYIGRVQADGTIKISEEEANTVWRM